MNQSAFQSSPSTIKDYTATSPQKLQSKASNMRKKWKKLYDYRKGRLHSPEQVYNKGYYMKTQPIQVISFFCNLNPHEVQHQKANKNRQLTRERIKKNDDIFYKKKNIGSRYLSGHKARFSSPPDVKTTQYHNFNNSHQKTLLNRIQIKQEIVLPFMLQKRKKKMNKQLSIIEHFSLQSLKKINGKQQLKLDLNQQQQQKLINRMKGTKLYYNFIKQWKTPTYQDQSQQPKLNDI